FAAGALDEDAAHGLGGRAEEVTAAVPGLVPVLSDESQVRLVDQGRGLQRVVRGLGRHASGGELPQLVLDEWEELLGRVGVTPINFRQDLSTALTRLRIPAA